MSTKQRDRGRILTPEGQQKLQQAIHAWEVQHERRCTQEQLRELTSAFKEGGLDPGTISKIRKAKGGVDAESIRCLFKTFGLELDEADLVSSAPFKIRVDSNFVGREEAIADLTLMVNRGAKIIVIQARGGVGKTTLARKYLQQEFGFFLEIPIAKETKDIASIESLIEEKLHQLGEEPGREFLVSLDRLKRKLQSEPIGILIDNLEPALDSAGKFIQPHRRYVELLRVLADPTVQSTTLITTRERLHESSITVQPYLLRSLDVEAWKQFFQMRQLPTQTPALAALHHAYGGNAKAMEIISGAIQQDYSGNVEAYWQLNQDDLLIEHALEDLVTSQFNRLQQLDPDAYKLLCRMGCYRYQDVPTVPIEGLFCLLWDVSENRHRRVIKSLQDRSLIESENNDYWLHPIIRAEGSNRLVLSEDWKIANTSIASFWTNAVLIIESIDDALMALEAYYHFVAIGDWAAASEVLIMERKNKWFRLSLEGESLGWSFQRLGLFQKFLSIDLIRENINVGYPLSKIYSLMGIMRWAMGDISESIKNQNMSHKIAKLCREDDCQYKNENLEFLLDKMEAQFLINVALCKISLHEFKEAESLLEKAILVTEEKEFLKNDYVAITCYLIFVKSCLGLQNQIRSSAANLYSLFEESTLGTRGRGYGLIFLASTYRNLGEFEIAFELYQRAINYAIESHYRQVEAKALSGLAVVYRSQGDLKEAEVSCLRAIEILEQLGAKSELAESYYELGLIYQALDKVENGSENFQEAIRLFSEMEAPKQVERVRRSMEREDVKET